MPTFLSDKSTSGFSVSSAASSFFSSAVSSVAVSSDANTGIATIDDVIIAVASTKLTNFLFIVNTLLEFTFDLFIKHAEPLPTLTLLRARLFYCDCIITTGS